MLSAGGVLAIVAILLHHLAERRFLAFVSMLVVAAGAHWAVGAAPILSLASPSVILCCLALAAIFAGTPLPHAFIAAAYVAVAFGAPMPEEAMAAATLSGMSRYLLTAIPFFLLAGALLTASGIASDLVRFAAALVGHRRAGLGQTVLLTGVLFSGASGSSIANAAFGTAAFMPQLTKRGTPPERAGALIAAVSVLDNIIPPSIAFLICCCRGSFDRQAPGRRLRRRAGHGGNACCCHPFQRCDDRERRQGVGRRVSTTWRSGAARLRSRHHRRCRHSRRRGGADRGCCIAAAYTLVAVILKRTAIQEIGVTFRQSARETAAILLLIGSATPFAFLIAVDGVAAQVSSAAAWLGSNPFLVIAALNLLLLGVGLFIDIGAAILLFAPLTLPVAVSAGIDSIHFGVILVVNLMIGGLTPPVGILVQTVGNASGVPVVALFAASRPYLLALLSALALLSFSAALAACF